MTNMLTNRLASPALRMLSSPSRHLLAAAAVCFRSPLMVPVAKFHGTTNLYTDELGRSYKGRRMGFRPWQRGFWIKEGERAEAGALIVRQVNIRYHPGEHVGIGRDKTLYALEAGQVYLTSEIIDPNWDNRFVQETYTGRKGQMLFKHFVHIARDPTPQKFKLVSNI